MCVTCVSTAGQAASWGTPALAAGAAAVFTGVRTRFPARGRGGDTGEPAEPVEVSIGSSHMTPHDT
ncbi:hypothetical protein BH20ACT3_BH20ACT3_15280 [soil metagenome]